MSDPTAATQRRTYAYAGPRHNPKLSTIMPAPGWGTGAWSCGYDATGNQTSIAESNDEGAVQTSVYDFAGDSRRTGFQPIVRLLQSEPRDRGDQRIDLTTEFLVDHAHE